MLKIAIPFTPMFFSCYTDKSFHVFSISNRVLFTFTESRRMKMPNIIIHQTNKIRQNYPNSQTVIPASTQSMEHHYKVCIYPYVYKKRKWVHSNSQTVIPASRQSMTHNMKCKHTLMFKQNEVYTYQ